MPAEILLLRVVHIVGGILWVGAMVLMTAFLMPAMRQAGPAGGAVMSALIQRRAMTYVPVVALLTLLSGFRLYWIVSGGLSSGYLATGAGLTFGISGLLATIAFLIGFFVTRPALARAGVVLGEMRSASEAERAQLQREADRLRARGRSASMVVTTMVLLAAIGMAVARYSG